MVNPTLVGEAPGDFTGVLWRRHERPSDQILIPQANITLRSGILAFEVLGDGIGDDDGACEAGEVCLPVQFELLGDGLGDEDGACEAGEPCQAPGTFPLIPDPATSPGSAPGDILDPAVNVSEFVMVINSCRSVWQAAAPGSESLAAVHANRFVDGAGAATNAAGYAWRTPPGNGPAQLAFESLVLIDNSYYSLNFDAKIVGHEVGHALSLFHGDGFDDNFNYLAPLPLPTGCSDPNFTNDNLDECPGDGMDCGVDPLGGPNLMQYAFNPGTTLTALQVNRLQLQSICLIPSATIDPVPQPVGDTREDAVYEDASPDFVDIGSYGVFVNSSDTETSLFSATVGLLPDDIADVHYYFAADLDNNSATGGMPSAGGVPIAFTGAELIADVEVSVTGGIISASGTAKRFLAGSFSPIPVVDVIVETGSVHFVPVPGTVPTPMPYDIPFNHVFGVTVSNANRGPVGTTIRLDAQGSSLDPKAADDTLDLPLQLQRPIFPECAVNPGIAQLGSHVTVTATGLIPNSMVKIFFGDQMLQIPVMTNGVGTAVIEFDVPEVDGSCGDRLITVGIADTSLTAECNLFVSGPGCPTLGFSGFAALAIGTLVAGSVVLRRSYARNTTRARST